MSKVIYRYQQNGYNELCLIRTDAGSLTVIVSKDRGNRTESICVPPEEVALMLQAAEPVTEVPL